MPKRKTRNAFYGITSASVCDIAKEKNLKIFFAKTAT